MHPEYVIVDCDAGTDDALALMMLITAHKTEKLKVAAITCVHGNTAVENVTENVFRTLHVCETTDIPVYKGAHSPLLDTHVAVNVEYHGKDGFGDVYTSKPDMSKLQKEHAVYALNKIVSANPGKVSIVCIGPLTNIALAIKMYPSFINNVSGLFIMGGNSTAQGNTTAQAEFNFYMDPESVHIVLNSNINPIWLLPWETCLKSQITIEWRKDVLGKVNNSCMNLINKIEAHQLLKKDLTPAKRSALYLPCDAILAGIVLNQNIAKDIVQYHADIELHGKRTRGQVVLDHLLSNKPNIFLVQDFDSKAFQNLLLSSITALPRTTTQV